MLLLTLAFVVIEVLISTAANNNLDELKRLMANGRAFRGQVVGVERVTHTKSPTTFSGTWRADIGGKIRQYSEDDDVFSSLKAGDTVTFTALPNSPTIYRLGLVDSRRIEEAGMAGPVFGVMVCLAFGIWGAWAWAKLAIQMEVLRNYTARLGEIVKIIEPEGKGQRKVKVNFLNAKEELKSIIFDTWKSHYQVGDRLPILVDPRATSTPIFWEELTFVELVPTSLST